MSLTDKAKDKAKKSPRLLLAVLVVSHLILISINRVPGQPNLRYLHIVLMAGAMPFQWGVTHTLSAAGSVWDGYVSLRGAKLENERLKARNTQVEEELLNLREKEKLFDQHNALVQHQTPTNYPRVLARVIGRDANNWFNTIIIDRGTASGVKKDHPVLSVEGGLVGRVIHVTPLSARVLMITDERHGAGAVIAQTAEDRLLGILKGKNQLLCEMRFVDTPGKTRDGEQVLTSGQDQLYPKGLLIGYVRNTGSPDIIHQSVEIKPAAQLQKLENVAVLTVPPEAIHGQYDELNKEEEEKEKQDKAPDRRRR
jgi:rod shape-determining protein MreC